MTFKKTSALVFTFFFLLTCPLLEAADGAPLAVDVKDLIEECQRDCEHDFKNYFAHELKKIDSSIGEDTPKKELLKLEISALSDSISSVAALAPTKNSTELHGLSEKVVGAALNLQERIEALVELGALILQHRMVEITKTKCTEGSPLLTLLINNLNESKMAFFKKWKLADQEAAASAHESRTEGLCAEGLLTKRGQGLLGEKLAKLQERIDKMQNIGTQARCNTYVKKLMKGELSLEVVDELETTIGLLEKTAEGAAASHEAEASNEA